MKPPPIALGCIFVGCSFFGCSKPPKKEEAKPVPSATASAPTDKQLAQATASSEAQFLSSLFERLEGEKRNRPTTDPNVEKVYGAIENKASVVLSDKKQVAAWPIGARFCLKAVTKNDVHVVACEFSDAAGATKGAAAASTTNKVIKRREVLVKNATSLSIQQSGESKEAESDARKIAEAFKAL